MSNSEVFSFEFDGQAVKRVAEADQKEGKFNDTFEPVKSPETGGNLKGTDQNTDNEFNTPPSLAHKIPLKTQCPPSPKKSNSFSTRKRIPVSSNVARTIPLDLSNQVESLFPKPIFEDLHRKIKKARKEN